MLYNLYMITRLKQFYKKREKRFKLVAILTIVIVMVVLINQPVLHGPYYVKYVYDGDTILISLDGQDTKIRLIGIDSPELEIDGIENEPGIKAKEYTTELLNHKYVYLQYDKERTDKYERTLAYVYLENQKMVNMLLVDNGYATTLAIAPNTRYKIRFWIAEKIYQLLN